MHLIQTVLSEAYRSNPPTNDLATARFLKFVFTQ
jgi:hypothetical protein